MIKLNDVEIPLLKPECFRIPARSKQIIHARVKKSENNAENGWIPLQGMEEGILFGNFIAKNINGKIVAECINTSDEIECVPIPEVELLDNEEIYQKHLEDVEGDNIESLGEAVIGLFNEGIGDNEEKTKNVTKDDEELEKQKRSDILDNLASARYITVVDLKSGFFQVKIHEDDGHKTAFSGLQGHQIEVYFDDIMVFAPDLEEHERRFTKLLKQLAAANLTIEPKKCQFLKKEAKVLGHIAGNGQIMTELKKLEVDRNYPQPKNVKKVKQFLGFADGPVLIAPDLEKSFVVTTDALDYAIGAILSQGEIGKDRPCEYASRCLIGSELRYPTYDKKLLAIVFAKEQFRPYLYRRKFTVVTDHEPLKHFYSSKKPDIHFNRPKAELRGHELEVIYRPSVNNRPPDALSLNPVLQEGEVNSEQPQQELYQLVDEQEKEEPADSDGPPARIFKVRATRKKRIQGNPKKIKVYDDEFGHLHLEGVSENAHYTTLIQASSTINTEHKSGTEPPKDHSSSERSDENKHKPELHERVERGKRGKENKSHLEKELGTTGRAVDTSGFLIWVITRESKGKYDLQYEGSYEVTDTDYINKNVKLHRGDEITVSHVDKIKKACMVKALPEKTNRVKQTKEPP
ncbi:uncharacterized protein LOC106641733 [Copidosoma floridanum]|uniref:uncharacterized protein LOC106641733 n=1 Tax=Copidosoma floridanum TaxID=29053 RepID=UPI0006C9BE14|nr:uncharacterized protein LOC106641733 [Copidosoma floridanum]